MRAKTARSVALTEARAADAGRAGADAAGLHGLVTVAGCAVFKRKHSMNEGE